MFWNLNWRSSHNKYRLCLLPFSMTKPNWLGKYWNSMTLAASLSLAYSYCYIPIGNYSLTFCLGWRAFYISNLLWIDFCCVSTCSWFSLGPWDEVLPNFPESTNDCSYFLNGLCHRSMFSNWRIRDSEFLVD